MEIAKPMELDPKASVPNAGRAPSCYLSSPKPKGAGSNT
jgi:hypothetical protein